MIIMAKTDLRDYSKSMASEEITNPLELLKSISSLLNTKGGITGPNEMSNIIGLMRNCQKLVGRCIYLSILRVTKSDECLKNFMSDGGWRIINKWLSDAKETENIPVVHEILKVLNRLPVTIQHLRENNTPKIVKHYAKASNANLEIPEVTDRDTTFAAQAAELKSSASVLMNLWMTIIRGGSAQATGDCEPPKKKKKEKEKKSKLESHTKPKSENNKPAPPVMKAPSFAKFRKTGLETEQTLPKLKAKTKSKQVSGKRNSADVESAGPEKKMKSAAEVKPKKIIMVSEGFMDALNSASNPLPMPSKKIKRRPLKPASQSPNSNSPNSSKSDLSPEIVTGDANDFSPTELLLKLSPKRTESPVPTEPTKPKLNKYGKPMKSVRFKSEEFLESVRYIEVDENERVNVTKVSYKAFISRMIGNVTNVNVATQNFKDAQHRETMIERQLLKGGTMSLVHEDTGEGQWRRPLPIDDLEALASAGCQSVEKDIQTEREKTVLMSIFLTTDMVPDTPTEPDPEPYEIMHPKIIPFDDENSIVEAMEPEPEQEQGTTANDVIMKNMLSGIQHQDGADLTEKLKQILQTASTITGANTTNGQIPNDHPMMQPQPGQEMLAPMMWNEEVPPQGNPQMGVMDMNGQQMQPQMGFYGTQMMVPMQDPNIYEHDWSGPPPQHHGPPPMGPHEMNGPPPPMYNQGWGGGGPQWRGPHQPRGGPPPRGVRDDYRGNWRGRWHNDGRR